MCDRVVAMPEVMAKLKASAAELDIRLDSEKLLKFEIYYQELIAWNRKMNLTAITAYEDVQIKHFLDSLTIALVLDVLESNPEARLIDIGTGAGLPGIPLKIIFPGLKLVLLEATVKKTGFLQNIKDKLGLKDIEIIAGRAEDIARDVRYREDFDFAVSRAVAKLPALIELALPFLRMGGSFVAQKKGDTALEIASAERAIHLLGGKLRKVKEVALPGLSDQRQLVVIDKVAETPVEYPRRSGIPAKRPIV